MYGLARGSVLFGNSTSLVTTGALALNNLGDSGSINTAAAGTNTTMTISEFQLGLQWDHQLQCIPANAFFRVGAEYQNWNLNNPRSVAATNSIAFLNATSTSAAATASNMNLSLVGVALATGFNW